MEKLLNIVRIVAWLLTLAGWGLSLHFMSLVGKDQQSMLVILFFSTWVSLPFITLILMDRRSSTWKPQVRIFLCAMMETVAIFSAIIYSGIFVFEGHPPAFIFLLTPAVSLVVIVVVFGVLRRMNNTA